MNWHHHTQRPRSLRILSTSDLPCHRCSSAASYASEANSDDASANTNTAASTQSRYHIPSERRPGSSRPSAQLLPVHAVTIPTSAGTGASRAHRGLSTDVHARRWVVVHAHLHSLRSGAHASLAQFAESLGVVECVVRAHLASPTLACRAGSIHVVFEIKALSGLIREIT